MTNTLWAIVAMGSIIPIPQGLDYSMFLILCLFYVFGSGINIAIRADYAFHSAVNCYPTRLSFLTQNYVAILIRVFFYDFALFYLWSLHPTWVASIASFFQVPSNIADWLTLPVNAGTAVLAGWSLDVLLDKIQSWIAGSDKPWISWANILFQGRVPQYNPAVVDTSKLPPEKK